MQAMKINCCKYVGNSGFGYFEPCVNLDLLTDQSTVELELSPGCYEILLKHLQRNNACIMCTMFLDQVKSLTLFDRIGFIVGIH